jgi:hypothetical protein
MFKKVKVKFTGDDKEYHCQHFITLEVTAYVWDHLLVGVGGPGVDIVEQGESTLPSLEDRVKAFIESQPDVVRAECKWMSVKDGGLHPIK